MTTKPPQIDEVQPYGKNAKEHTDKQLLQLANIVKKVGWRQPVVVNQKGVIIVGHGRYLAWKKFGEKMLLKPAWIIDDMGRTISGGPEETQMSEEDERTYRLADNKLNESKWEMDLVIAELKLLQLPDVILSGFNPNLILETKEDMPELKDIGVPRTQLGDLYELGNHKLICGNSTDPETYKIWLKNSLIYSPSQLYHRIYEPCMVLWKEGKTHYQDFTFSNFTELWNLDKKTFAEHLDIWYQKRDNTNKYIHPTQKPVQLAERAIKRASAKGDLVLDAFGGSGSTMIACDQLERQARLIELDPKFVDAIVGRWVQYSENTRVIKNGEEIIW